MAETDKSPSPDLASSTAHGSDAPSTSEKNRDPQQPSGPVSLREDGKIECTEEDNYEHTGYCFPKWKKWMILTVIFAVQVSMNFNTSIYPNVVMPLTKTFVISGQAARTGQMIYLVLYAFGCELWAPWWVSHSPFCRKLSVLAGALEVSRLSSRCFRPAIEVRKIQHNQHSKPSDCRRANTGGLIIHIPEKGSWSYWSRLTPL